MNIRKRANPGEAQAFLYWAVEQKTDRCILWPFGRFTTGYGTIQFEGVHTHASAAVCVITHGECPPHKHDAAHKCGVKLCVNPRHLYWATQMENSHDRWAHGTIAKGEGNGSHKLTEVEVLAIYTAPGFRKDIAPKYGVSARTVGQIKNGETWGWLTNEQG